VEKVRSASVPVPDVPPRLKLTFPAESNILLSKCRATAIRRRALADRARTGVRLCVCVAAITSVTSASVSFIVQTLCGLLLALIRRVPFLQSLSSNKDWC
jgi:hypothetical protein